MGKQHGWLCQSCRCSALFPVTLSQGNKQGRMLTWPCSFPSLGRPPLPRESSPSHPSTNTSLIQIVIVEGGLWINYYRDPHSGVKNFLELLSEKSKFAFK